MSRPTSPKFERSCGQSHVSILSLPICLPCRLPIVLPTTFLARPVNPMPSNLKLQYCMQYSFVLLSADFISTAHLHHCGAAGAHKRVGHSSHGYCANAATLRCDAASSELVRYKCVCAFSLQSHCAERAPQHISSPHIASLASFEPN